MRFRRFFPELLIALAVLLAYGDTFRCPFIFDDEGAILANPTIRQFSTSLTPPCNGVVVQRRPVVNFSLALNYAISGYEPWSYHVFNFAAHLAAAWLLFGIVRRTLPDRSAPVALAVALLWAVHPLLTEAVTYVSQRTEVLAGLFYLLSLYCAIRNWPVAAVAACALALGSKETAVSLPIMIVLYDRAFSGMTWHEQWRKRWKLYAALAATWLVPIVLLPYGNERTAVFGNGGDAIEYAMQQCGFILYYLRLSFWPHPLVIDYGLPFTPTTMQVVPNLLLLTALGAAVVLAWRRRPWLGFLGVWFFAILAPSSSFILLPEQIASEKRMYLPLAAVVAAVVLLLRRIQYGRWMVTAVACLLVAMTFCRNCDYCSSIAIWQDAARKQPGNARAFNNLGVSFGRNHYYREAAVAFYQAILLAPDYPDAYNNLATAFQLQNRPDKAARCRQLAKQYGGN